MVPVAQTATLRNRKYKQAGKPGFISLGLLYNRIATRKILPAHREGLSFQLIFHGYILTDSSERCIF